MSIAVGRRGFLLGLGALAALPAPALALTRAHASAPEGDFVLERVLVRGLSDGKRIVVTRRWSIAFAPSDKDGLRVTGEQSFAQVDAPPPLQALAAIEAGREEAGFLPLQLDRSGAIVSPVAGEAPPALPDDVVSAALAFARARSAGDDVSATARQFVTDLSQRGHEWLTKLPRDLFFPEPRDRSASRDIALPDGTQGHVTLRERALADGGSGLLREFAREAETSTATFSQKGSDRWTLWPTVL